MKIVNKPLVDTADISQGKETKRKRVTNAIGVIAFFCILYLALGWLGAFLGARIPDSWEARLAMSFTDEEQSSLTDERALRLFEKLTVGEDLRELPYRLFEMDLDIGANAFAIPGGGIGLTPELLEEVNSDIGLAFVIAHELGHHQHRDITRRLGRALLFGLVTSTLFHSSGIDPLQHALHVAESGYSRDQEREADRFAMELVHRKFGTSAGALEFFAHIHSNKEENLLQMYIGTHPLTTERMQDLRALRKDLNARD